MSSQSHSIDSTNAGRYRSPLEAERAAVRFKTLRQKYENKSPDQFLNDLCERILSLNRYQDLRRVRKWKRNFDFYMGSHFGHWDQTGLWVVDEVLPDDHLYANNQYAYFVRSVLAQWTRANTTFEIRPRSDDPQVVGASRIADTIVTDWFIRRWQEEQRQIEAIRAQLTGNYLRKLQWAKKSGVPAWVPHKEQIQIAGEDEGWQCLECGMVGAKMPEAGGSYSVSGAAMGEMRPPLDDLGLCPKCGSANIEEFGLPPLSVDVVTGHDEIEGGDVLAESVDPMEVSLHSHATEFDLSPYFTRAQLFLAEILQHHFPDMEIPYGATANIKLAYQRAIEMNPGNTDYSWLNDGSMEGMSEYEEHWISPEMYSWYVTPELVRQSGEIQLDPKTALIEMCPAGMYLSRIGGKIAIGPEPENKSDYWLHGRFHMVPSAIWGRGQDDAVQENEQLNRAENLWHDIIMNHASRMTAINPLHYDAEEVSGNPDDILLMQTPNIDDEPGRFIWQSSPAGAPPDVPAFLQTKNRNMQAQFSAFAVLQGDSEGGEETATGRAILRDQAIMQHGPALALKALVDVKTGQKVLKIYQRNWEGKRFYYTRGQYDDYEGRYFESADIQGDFEWVARPGSWTPRGEGEKRATIIEAGNWGGVPLGIFNPQLQPKLRRFLLDEYGLAFDADDVAPDYRKQRLEIKRLEDILPDVIASFAEMGVPEMLPPGVPGPDGVPSMEETPHPMIVAFLSSKIEVDPIIDNHQVHIEAIKHWMLTDKGMAAHPILKEALKIHIQKHFEGEVQMQQAMATMMLLAQGPQMMAQEAQAANESERRTGEKSGPDSGKKTAPKSQSNTVKKGSQLQKKS